MQLTMLIVDDDILIRRALVRALPNALRARGVELTVLEAPDVQQAKNVLKNRRQEIGLILSDVHMPGGDGTVLYADTVGICQKYGIAFWMMSGGHSYLIPTDVDRWSKPLDVPKLADAIAQIARQRHEDAEDPDTGPTFPNPDSET